MSEPEINALLDESRVFPSPAAWRQGARVTDPGVYERAARDPEAFWESFARELEWIAAVDAGARLEAAAREVVRRRQAEHQRQLPRPARSRLHRAQQGRDHLGRRARRSPDADLLRSAPPGLPVRQRAQVARRQERRSRRDLHAAHPRAGDRDARVRAHRRRPQRRVRRLQRRVAARSHQRRAGHACSSPPTAATGAAQIVPLKQMADEALQRHAVDQARRRRAARRGRRRSRCTCRRAATTGITTDGGRVRRTVRRSRWTPRTCSTSSTRRARPESRRASSTRPAATSSARTRRRSGCSICATTTCTGAPPTSAGSPATATSCTVRSRTARPC